MSTRSITSNWIDARATFLAMFKNSIKLKKRKCFNQYQLKSGFTKQLFFSWNLQQKVLVMPSLKFSFGKEHFSAVAWFVQIYSSEIQESPWKKVFSWKKAEKGVYSAKPDDYQMDFLIEYCHEARDKKAATAENRKKWKWLKKTEKNEMWQFRFDVAAKKNRCKPFFSLL